MFVEVKSSRSALLGVLLLLVVLALLLLLLLLLSQMLPALLLMLPPPMTPVSPPIPLLELRPEASCRSWHSVQAAVYRAPQVR